MREYKQNDGAKWMSFPVLVIRGFLAGICNNLIIKTLNCQGSNLNSGSMFLFITKTMTIMKITMLSI
jgi:hypothetical protein